MVGLARDSIRPAVVEVRGAAPLVTPTARPKTGSRFIAGPMFDTFFLLLPPLLALVAAEVIELFDSPFDTVKVLGGSAQRVTVFVNIWTWAHLIAVFFRSHANPDVFGRHPLRFTLVPALLFVAMLSSQWIFVTAAVVAILWDVYHSSMQTFGFCRIYDGRLGNPAEQGRMLDVWLNHVIYIGPILAGLSLGETIDVLDRYSRVGWDAPGQLAAEMKALSSVIGTCVIVGGSAFVAFYVFAFRRLAQNGYRISRQKIVLLVSTGITSIWAWGFLPPLEAFFIANLFHGLQYFAIVWCVEKKNVRRVFGLGRIERGSFLALLAFAAVLLGGGFLYEIGLNASLRWSASVALVVSLMHFWYDGFVWSVRKREV